MQKVYAENFCQVEIRWTKPIKYENTLNLPEEKMDYAWYYKILAKYPTGEYKLLYIGKTERFVAARLKDRDHKNRIEKLKKDYPKHKITVSLGNVYMPYSPKPKTVDQIETLLIFANSDLPFITNRKKIWGHRIQNDYIIINKGFRRGGMKKEIHLGVFTK